MTIGSKSWREGIQAKTKYIYSEFLASGQRPLSFPSMHSCLKLFKDGGISLSEENISWMKCHETVQMEVMSVPQEIDRKPHRIQTVDVNYWLFSIEQFNQIYP